MSLQTITLNIPDTIYQRAQHTAKALQRPTADVLVDTLNATLPPLDDVPIEMASELAAMALLSTEVLIGIAQGTMSIEHQEQLHTLLDKQNEGNLTETDHPQLTTLMAEYGRTMLRRAHAVALLTGRGHPIPPLQTITPIL